MLSRLKPRTPSPLLQPQPERIPLQTPQNILELETQAQALQKYRMDRTQEANSPTDEAVRCLVKSAHLAMHSAALLAEENSRLRAENARQKRKQKVRRSYVARGGILTAQEGLQLAEERAQRKQRGGVRNPTALRHLWITQA